MVDLSFEKDGKLIVAHVMGMNIFAKPPLTACRDAVREIYLEWLGLRGADSFTFYATETMSKHRKVTGKTLDMLPAWLDADPPRDFLTIDLNAAASFDAESETRIFIHSYEAKARAKGGTEGSILRLTLPRDRLPISEFRDRFVSAVERLPLVSAAAGEALVTSKYKQRDAETEAWKASMRHPGADIYAGLIDGYATGVDGLKTVNWLTAINGEMVAALGGRAAIAAALPGAVTLIPIGDGLVLQAGPEPRLGDVNRGDTLPLYRAVDAALKPLRERNAEEAKSFVVGGDDGTAAGRWYARFEPA